MGIEIDKLTFTKAEEESFIKKLREETKILMEMFKQNRFQNSSFKCGYEVEAWVTDNDFLPAPYGEEFIKRLNHPLVVPEISKFNFELNGNPTYLDKGALFNLERDLTDLWMRCYNKARELNHNVVSIGSLPTVGQNMLTLENMSPQKRYYALNDQVLKLRKNKPIVLDIKGKEHLYVECNDVMTESAATSLQIHLQVSPENAGRFYNASIISSAFLVALSANSPLFFGKRLWDETRIALFEQSVDMPSFRGKNGEVKRVGMGSGYVQDSLFELFLENLDGFVPLLPMIMDEPTENLAHLRLHNGTIWRWNRPLIGLEGGAPHLRLEQRTPSSGPTVKDMVANMAFYFGMVHYLGEMKTAPEQLINFEDAKENFYQACQHSFNAQVKWVDGKHHNLQTLLLNEILPPVRESLNSLYLDDFEIREYFDNILRPRTKSGQNGANWQKAFISTHGMRLQELTQVYSENQLTNRPVHEWTI